MENICENMQLFPKEDFLTGDQLMFEYNPEVTRTTRPDLIQDQSETTSPGPVLSYRTLYLPSEKMYIDIELQTLCFDPSPVEMFRMFVPSLVITSDIMDLIHRV